MLSYASGTAPREYLGMTSEEFAYVFDDLVLNESIKVHEEAIKQANRSR